MKMSKYFEKTQNMSKFLTKLEERVSEKDFLSALLREASLDPENVKVGVAHIPDEKCPKPVIVGEHAMLRGKTRLSMDAGAVLQIAIDTLENPFIGAEVVSHPVVWDEDQDQAVPYYEPPINGTAVISERERYTLVFEAGFSYILVKTVWNNAWGQFCPKKTSAVIRIDRFGAITKA